MVLIEIVRYEQTTNLPFPREPNTFSLLLQSSV